MSIKLITGNLNLPRSPYAKVWRIFNPDFRSCFHSSSWVVVPKVWPLRVPRMNPLLLWHSLASTPITPEKVPLSVFHKLSRNMSWFTISSHNAIGTVSEKSANSPTGSSMTRSALALFSNLFLAAMGIPRRYWASSDRSCPSISSESLLVITSS